MMRFYMKKHLSWPLRGKSSQMATALWHSDLRENLFSRGRGESKREDMLFQNLKPLQPTQLPFGQAGCTNICTVSCLPYLWESIRSFYVNLQVTGAWFCYHHLRPDRAPNLDWEPLLEQGNLLCAHILQGLNVDGQRAGFPWMHKPFSTSDLFNWKKP